MKKFLSLLCMITCVFGLTACGSTVEYTQYEQDKMETAKQLAATVVVPSFEDFKDESLQAQYQEYTAEEVAYTVKQVWGIEADGYAFMTAVESFTSSYEEIGDVVSIGEPTAEIDDKQIIVLVPVQGSNKNAEAEVIFSNDYFTKFESASLNPEATMGDLMSKAALNTLIGMGTVFVVLILICLIISCFALIPKIQAAFSKKNKKEDTKTTGVDNAVAQIVVQEEANEEADDLELVAVIAAAIAASEGATSTDGFVVRSIRKVRCR
ncbi:MAG: hypothetical protein E7291_01605 [Lachnospiraceae bacterium]|nr:hypothetical protein [Lachnospiraceae bacterium]